MTRQVFVLANERLRAKAVAAITAKGADGAYRLKPNSRV